MTVYILILLIILTFVFGFKNTIFEISWKKRGFAGLLIAREVFLLIIVGVLIFHINQTEGITTFYVDSASIAETEMLVLSTLLGMLVLISVFSKTIFRKYLYERSSSSYFSNIHKNETYLLYSILLLILLLDVIFLASGMKNALIEAIIFNRDLMTVRLHNSYGTIIPTFLVSFYSFLVYFLAITMGLLVRKKSKIVIVIWVLFLFLSAGFFGGKAPVFVTLFLFFLAILSRKEISLSRILVLSVPLTVILIFLIFFMVKVQYPDIESGDFLAYMIQRIGVGQIQGVYEQFALQIRDSDYIWHTVPFANFVIDAPAFNKDLMLSTWGQNVDSESTGVMNSYFIGEALAIGGYVLVYFSPVIVAFSYCLTFAVFFILFKWYFSFNKGVTSLYIKLLLPTVIIFTGDIAGFLFLKLLVMLMIFITVVFIVFVLIKTFISAYKNNLMKKRSLNLVL